jgi:hypothetical protein
MFPIGQVDVAGIRRQLTARAYTHGLKSAGELLFENIFFTFLPISGPDIHGE